MHTTSFILFAVFGTHSKSDKIAALISSKKKEKFKVAIPAKTCLG
jgi:hypothetical protein